MIKDREFRELQVSSTHLAIIFLGILIVGVVIFLLGVSVGKKHAQVAGKAILVSQKEAEPVKEKIVIPEIKPKTKPATQAPVKETAKDETSAKTEPPPEKPTAKLPAQPELKQKEEPKPKTEPGQPGVQPQAPGAKKNLYYVQVGALADKPSALSAAQKFRTQGYSVIVLDPFPTDKKPVYRVRVGGFSTKEEAAAVRTKLAAATGRRADYFIVRD